MFTRHTKFFIQDVSIILLSVLIAMMLVKTDVLVSVLTSTREWGVFGSFVAGIFFTSIFTTAPAIATLGEIAQAQSLFWTAFWGAAGAVVGDVIIFHFVRDRFSDHLVSLIRQRSLKARLKTLRLTPFFRWVSFLLGGLVIASPLPDELGVSILGFSKLTLSWFIPFSFLFNFLGIIVIGLVARAW